MKLSYNTDLLLKASRWTALAFIFFLPISTALMNIFLALTILLLALSGQYGRHFNAIVANRFVITGLLLLTLTFIGVFYSSAGFEYGMARFQKYAKLLLVFFLFPIFINSGWREKGLLSFLAAMTLTLLVIYAMWLGLIDERPRDGDKAVTSFYMTMDGGFKSRIITSIFMAFATYAFAVLSLHTARYRPLLLLLTTLGAGYVLVISTGLTGRAILFALLALFVIQTIGVRKGTLYFLLCTTIALPLMYQLSDSLRERIHEARHMTAEVPEGEIPSSMNQRLKFLQRGIQEISDQPFFGTGSGGIRHGPDPQSPHEPLNLHNQYLMIWGELGIAGFLLLLLLFYSHWSLSKGLPETERRLSQGVLTTMAVGCLFNSLLLDSGESHFYFLFATIYLSRLAELEQNSDG